MSGWVFESFAFGCFSNDCDECFGSARTLPGTLCGTRKKKDKKEEMKNKQLSLILSTMKSTKAIVIISIDKHYYMDDYNGERERDDSHVEGINNRCL